MVQKKGNAYEISVSYMEHMYFTETFSWTFSVKEGHFSNKSVYMMSDLKGNRKKHIM